MPTSGFHILSQGNMESSLAPKNAVGVPYVKFILANSTENDVKVSGITVEVDTAETKEAFADIELLDGLGFKIGTAKTFDAKGVAELFINDTIPAKKHREYRLVARMSDCAEPCKNNGKTASMRVTQVHTTSQTVEGLPLVTAQHIYNTNLTVAGVTITPKYTEDESVSDEARNTTFNTFEIRNTGNEEALIAGVRFTYRGTMSRTEITNMKITLHTEVFPVAWADDNTVVVGAISKQISLRADESLTVSISGDIARNAKGYAQFDIHDPSDITILGLTYGYGIPLRLNAGHDTKPFILGKKVQGSLMKSLPSVL